LFPCWDPIILFPFGTLDTVFSLATTLLATNPTIPPDPTLSVINLSTKLVPGSVLIPTTPLSTSSLSTNSVSQHQQFVTLPHKELHKDFIICYFNGKPLPFNQIQSVFNHMWGKGRRLEIHNNPFNRSAIVRIPSEFLRYKILDKCIWYVGDSMFHTALWSSAHSSSAPPLKAIKI
ncbi:unnamed protein product, partial [Brassica oleracea var. botrytis]